MHKTEFETTTEQVFQIQEIFHETQELTHLTFSNASQIPSVLLLYQWMRIYHLVQMIPSLVALDGMIDNLLHKSPLLQQDTTTHTLNLQ